MPITNLLSSLITRYSIYQIHNAKTNDCYYELLSTHTFSIFAKIKLLKLENKLNSSDIYIIPTVINPKLAFNQFIVSD